MIGGLSPEALGEMAVGDAAGLHAMIRRILESERRVKAYMQVGLEKRRRDMAHIEQRQRAERAYRGMHKRSR